MTFNTRQCNAMGPTERNENGTTYNDSWLDKITTPLNSCSLETFPPISSIDAEGKATETTKQLIVVPLVIGCYQLNEPSSSAALSTEKDDDEKADGINAKEIEDGGSGIVGDGGGLNERKSSRSGELRLFMVPAPAATSTESESSIKFGEPSCVVEMESGVLDGKWRRRFVRSGEYNEVSGGEEFGALDCDNNHAGNNQSTPIFASACASGRIHIHSLTAANTTESNDSSSSPSKAWHLSHISSSEEPPSVEDGTGSSPLCLSLAWNDHHHHLDMEISKNNSSAFTNSENNNPFIDQIVSSYSNGTVALHEVSCIQSVNNFDETEVSTGSIINNHTSGNLTIRETHRWKAHTMFGCPSEVWTCSFLRGSENVVMSGADDVRRFFNDIILFASHEKWNDSDSHNKTHITHYSPLPFYIYVQCSLKIWDIRQTQRPTHKIGDTEFEAGVTAISSHPALSHVFAVGSYDEYVRVYDHRKMDMPLWKMGVGGGVWRIKWHPLCWDTTNTSTKGYYGKMLVAAMHGGCRVLDFEELNSWSEKKTCDDKRGDDEVKVLSKFTAHESMAYGSDWLWFGQSTIESVASCSFYDRQAFLWDPYNG